MASSPPERVNDDDETLALAMMDGDQAALRRVLERYGGKVRGWLKKHFGDVLQPPELDEAFNQAAFNVWRFAGRFDPAKGSLGGWFLSIAQRAAQSVLRQENKHLAKNLEYEAGYDPAGQRR